MSHAKTLEGHQRKLVKRSCRQRAVALFVLLINTSMILTVNYLPSITLVNVLKLNLHFITFIFYAASFKFCLRGKSLTRRSLLVHYVVKKLTQLQHLTSFQLHLVVGRWDVRQQDVIGTMLCVYWPGRGPLCPRACAEVQNWMKVVL